MTTRPLIIRPPAATWRQLPAHLRALPEYGDLLYTLSLHRIHVRYRQTVLGVVWAVLFSVYLAGVALFVLHAICLMCSALYLVNLALLVAAWRLRTAVRTVGLDPYLGFLHQVEYNRPSLALDLMEPFRPIVVDSVVLRCINNGIVLPEHFAADPKGPYPVRLVDEGRSRFIRELEGRLNLTFTDPESGERVTYRRLLELQARQIARALQTGERFRPFRVR